MKIPVLTAFALACAASAAPAAIVTVTIEGFVVFNAVSTAPLNAVGSGDSAIISFTVDSANFVDGIPGDVRGYVIDQSSFKMDFNAPPVSVTLLNPFPAGTTPYFGLVDGFPVSDGFFVSSSPTGPGGVPISQTPLQANFDVGYIGSTLSSLNIEDAYGVYDFTGLTRFSYTLWQAFPDNARMEIDFSRMTITPGPSAAGLLGVAGLCCVRRRR